LIDGDSLALSVAALLRRAPWLVAALPFVLLRGRASLKSFVAGRHVPDPASFAFRADVIEFLRQERARGRRIILATAAHRRIAEAVARHLDLFDGVIATDGFENYKGDAKAIQICKTLGQNDFDYIGDSSADIPVFKAARFCYLVAPSDALRRAAAQVGRIRGEFASGRSRPAR
jgi:phosphoserine phosphatase